MTEGMAARSGKGNFKTQTDVSILHRLLPFHHQLIPCLLYTSIRLSVNVEFPHEYSGIKEVGAEGVGLFRTEFFLSLIHI